MDNKGIVFLVGAGPGDPELITVKGQRTLQECDTVVYDRLAPLELVVTLPRHIKRFFVGKSSGKHSLPQDQINALLVELATQGLKVVRLKGGDPFIFGRGGEEALYLKQSGIPFEIIPGITAGLSVPAYAGIPITHRNISAFCVLVTAHEAEDKSELQVPWEWLSGVQHGTIVGYMGVKQLANTIAKLTAAGFDPRTPAALIQRGTTGAQKCIIGEIADLAELAQQANILPPALFVIGEVVGLAENLNWFGKGALFGKRIWVTRPADQAGDMYRLLRSQGAEVLPLPTIATTEFRDDAAWDKISRARGEFKDRWLVFTSENGVRYFQHQMAQKGYDARFWGKFKIAAVGSGTAQELQKYNLKADFIPTKATTAALADELAALIIEKGCLVVRVRGNLGDDRVERTLQAAGTRVFPLQVYTTETASWDAGMWAALEDNHPDIITFTSGSTVTGFCEILGMDKARKIASKAVVTSIGPMTTRIAAELGFKVQIEASEYSISGLVKAIVLYFENQKSE